MTSCCIGKMNHSSFFIFREMNRKSNDKCIVGIAENEECHRQVYGKTIEKRRVSELEVKERKLIAARAEVCFDCDSVIRVHHEKFHFTRYEGLQKTCTDPLKVHSTKQMR